MLDKLREVSINLWSPIGEFFSSIFESSNIWFPIISFIVIAIVGLFLLRKVLDITVSKSSTLSLTELWSFLKKAIFYILILAVLGSLYFYLEEIYSQYENENMKKQKSEQSLDYLLR